MSEQGKQSLKGSQQAKADPSLKGSVQGSAKGSVAQKNPEGDQVSAQGSRKASMKDSANQSMKGSVKGSVKPSAQESVKESVTPGSRQGSMKKSVQGSARQGSMKASAMGSKQGASNRQPSIKEEEEDGFIDYNHVNSQEIERRKKALMENFKDESLQQPPDDESEAHQPVGQASFNQALGEDVQEAEPAQEMLEDKEPSIDPEEKYAMELEQYHHDLEAYEVKKKEYAAKLKENSHIDFKLLVFLPEIKDNEQLKELMDSKYRADLRFMRTKSIIGVEEEFVPFDQKLAKRLADGEARKAKKVLEEEKKKAQEEKEKAEGGKKKGKKKSLKKKKESDVQLEGGDFEDDEEEYEMDIEMDDIDEGPRESAQTNNSKKVGGVKSRKAAPKSKTQEPPQMIMLDEMDDDCIAKDPLAEEREAERLRAKAERRAERRRIKQEKKEEERRLEEERLANLPPPPIQPRRWDFKFEGLKTNQGLEVEEGTAIKAPNHQPTLLILGESTKVEPYVEEDFAGLEPKEPHADEAAAEQDPADQAEQPDGEQEGHPEEEQKEAGVVAAAGVEEDWQSVQKEEEPAEDPAENLVVVDRSDGEPQANQPEEYATPEDEKTPEQDEDAKEAQADQEQAKDQVNEAPAEEEPEEKPAEDAQEETPGEEQQKEEEELSPSEKEKREKAERKAERERKREEREKKKAEKEAKKADKDKKKDKKKKKKKEELEEVKEEEEDEEQFEGGDDTEKKKKKDKKKDKKKKKKKDKDAKDDEEPLEDEEEPKEDQQADDKEEKKDDKDEKKDKEEEKNEKDEKDDENKSRKSEQRSERKSDKPPASDRQSEKPPPSEKQPSEKAESEKPKSEAAAAADEAKREKPRESQNSQKSQEEEELQQQNDEQAEAAKEEESPEQEQEEQKQGNQTITERPEDEEEDDGFGDLVAAAVNEVEDEEQEQPPEEEEAAAAAENVAPVPKQPWVCPPLEEIPLRVQKNKVYFQLRLDGLEEGEGRPRINIGVCLESYAPEEGKDFSRQEGVWCLNLFSGDKYHAKRWRNYYEVDSDQNQFALPRYGLFEAGCVIGVLIDMDRGVLSYFKDGNDLGPAFVSQEFKNGGLRPFIVTRCPCRLSIFHPFVFPWFVDVPVEPVAPEEPSRDSSFYKQSEVNMTPFPAQDITVGTQLETEGAWIQDSLDYIPESQRGNELEERPYDMRDSNRFSLNLTKGHVIPQRESEHQRQSLKYKHHDLNLDHHTKHVRELKRRPMFQDSQHYEAGQMKDLYFEEHDPSFQESGVVQPEQTQASLRPTQQSTDLNKKKLHYLQQKEKNKRKEIELLKMKLKLQTQMNSLKALEKEVVLPDPTLENPTMKDAWDLAMFKAKHGTFENKPEHNDQCSTF